MAKQIPVEEIEKKLDAFRVGMKVSVLVKEAYKNGEITLDFRGHCRNGDVRAESLERELSMAFLLLEPSKRKLQSLLHALKTKTPLDKPVRMGHSMLSCYDCGDFLRWDFDGVNIVCRSECQFKDGLKPFVFELNVPSGRMVVANDLRSFFPIAGDYNVNTTLGLFQTTMKYAEAGLAHGFVGNTCPGVYKFTDSGKPPTKFIISSGNRRGGSGHKKTRSVAGICTDLWWYSICDEEELARHFPDYNKPEYQNHLDMVTCKPGVYRFSHEYHMLPNRDANGAIYCQIEWLRDPDPLKDYQAGYKGLNFTAGQLVRDSISRYSTLYDQKTKMEKIQRVVDHIFLTNGNGLEIHPNGWIGDAPDLKSNAPDMEIPVLEGKFRWYPGHDWCYLAHCAGFANKFFERHKAYPLNESFTALAFNICHNIIKYGADTLGSYMRNKEEAEKEQEALVRLAKRAIKAFAKQYPDRIPEYCKPILREMKV